MDPYKTLLFLARLGLALLLTQSAQPAAAQSEADLELNATANRKTIKFGEEVIYTITLTNLGPAEATDLYFVGVLPDPLNPVSFSCSAGTTAFELCRLESLASGATVTAILVATPISNPARSDFGLTNTFFETESATPDPNIDNNRLFLPIRVVGKRH
jgi:uncharacterized repeat protein (TIGR01451 family)